MLSCIKTYMNECNELNVLYCMQYNTKDTNVCTQYKMGDFSFIADELMRKTLQEDYEIINKANLWDALKNRNNKPFMFDSEWNIELSNSHSGASHALSLRTFELIAKKGWTNYVDLYLKKYKNSS